MLTGCKNHTVSPKILKDAQFVLNYNSQKFSGNFEFYEDNTLNVKVESPDSLEGLSATVSKSKATVSYKGLEKKFSLDNFPQGAVFKMIYNLFVTVRQKSELNFDEKDGFYTTEFDSDYGRVKLVINEDNMVKSISVPQSEFYLELIY